MGVGEAGVRGDEEDVAGERHFEAAGDGDTVDGANDGFAEAVEGGDGVVLAFDDGLRVGAAGAEFFEVEAGAESAFAGAGEDGDFHVLVVVEGGESFDQAGADGGGEGVHLRGAVDGNGGDGAVEGGEDFGHSLCAAVLSTQILAAALAMSEDIARPMSVDHHPESPLRDVVLL